MKKTKLCLLLCLSFLTVLPACHKEKKQGEPEPVIKSVVLDNASLFMKVGEEYLLNVSVSPKTDVVPDWRSLDDKVVTVSPDGLVMAVGEGKTSVIVSAGELSDTCSVTVNPDYEIDYTVMLYGCAGGNLDTYIYDNLSHAEKYGSTDKVKMTALLKFSKTNTGEPNTNFYDLKDKKFEKSKYADKSFDMSDPDNLAEYIRKSAELYPADNYILVITNHGSQWDSGYDLPVVSKAMVFDDNTGYKALSIYGLEEGIRRSGYHFDVVYPDICLFGMIEMMNQLDGVTDYVLASSNLVLGSGGDYYNLLRNLNSGKSTEENICEYMDDLMDFWKASLYGYSEPIDITFLKPSQIKVLYPPIMKFKDRFLEIQKNADMKAAYDKLIAAQRNFYFFDNDPSVSWKRWTSVDALDMMTRVAEVTGDEIFKQCRDEMDAALKSLYIKACDDGYKRYVKMEDGFSLGLQWNIQGGYAKYHYDRGYAPSKFNQATGWSEFLEANVD